MALSAIAKQLFGSANDRILTKLQPQVEAINALEPVMEGLSDEQLRARTDVLKARFKAGESLDDLLVDAFATVREAAKRTLGERAYDVQLVGGMVLHQGRIAEDRRGQDPCVNAADLSQCPPRAWLPRCYSKRLSGKT